MISKRYLVKQLQALTLICVAIGFLASCASAPVSSIDNPQAVKESRVHQVSVSVELDMARAQAWEILQDFSVAHKYVPGLTHTQIVTRRKNNVGARRLVYSGKYYKEETIIEWNEGQGFLMKLHEGVEPVSIFSFSQFRYQLEAMQNDKTKVILSMYYQLPWGLFGRALNATSVGMVVKGSLRDVAAGMKYYYETGKSADNNIRKQYWKYVQLVDAG